jgi:antitoxin (DNA-binding transcriptional repressor) of toxin-antitoxin stability system
VADIVPHRRRTRWLPGDRLAQQLEHRAADPVEAMARAHGRPDVERV